MGKIKTNSSNKNKKQSAAHLDNKQNRTDLIKTIDEHDEINNQTDESDHEVEYQPTKQRKKMTDFDNKFEFISSVAEYQKDTWNDLLKFIKKSNRGKVEDKIANVVSQRTAQKQEIMEDNIKVEDEELDISDDELQHDNIRVRGKKVSKKATADNEKDFFEDLGECEQASTFYEMNLSRPLMKAIGALGYVHPTPIQSATIPIALEARDICGCAATGTGKTAAYMLPTIERLLFKPSAISNITRVLVLVPTRELGTQVYQVTKQLCQFTSIDIGMAIGGLDVKAQEAVLRKNPDIVIATPGRLIDHLKNTPSFSLDSIEVLILDEADRMLDQYFAEQMKEIIKSCSHQRQTMLFSATMTEEVKDLVAISLNRPVKVFVNSNQTVAFNLRQEFIRIRENKEEDREPILAALVCRTFHEHCMVFVQTKKTAHRLRILLGLLGIKAGELHGDLTQANRLESLEQFKSHAIDVLIATDVAARGLDISGVTTVINFVMPISVEHYIHRVGRTARAGRAGISVSLVGESERKMVKDIIKSATNTVKNRIIPPEIVDKYRKKVQALESEIEKVLQEEVAEKMLRQAEHQLNKTEKKLMEQTNKKAKDDIEISRQWFQTRKQKIEEKSRLSIFGKEDKNAVQENSKKMKTVKRKTDDSSDLEDNFFAKKTKQTVKSNVSKPKVTNPKQLAADRAQKELELASLTRAKLEKYKHKQRKINFDPEPEEKKKMFRKKFKRSNFSSDLADTSNANVKQLRYNASKKKRIDEKSTKVSRVKLTNKAGLNKKNKGKHFGAPKQKKSKF